MKIAIVGASGLVGRVFLEQLENNNPNDELIAYCSGNSAGKCINNHKLIELKNSTLKKVDFALFSAGSEVSKQWANEFIKKGAVIIDNSNAFRREETVPLVVPEININEVSSTTNLIANPNCSTIQIALPLYYISQLYKIKRVIVSTYQSVSGAGQKGINDFENNTQIKFPYKIQNNLIPQIDIPLDNGFTLEEDKIRFELRKILSLPSLKVSATAVRVPIKNCHGASVYVEFEEAIILEKIKKHLQSSPGIILQDELNNLIYPQPLTALNTDKVYVGRLRKDLDFPNALSFWCVADNLRKGAASNAIQIMNKIRNLIKNIN